MAKKLKPTIFDTSDAYDKELLHSIESLGLNFSEETKLLWSSKLKSVDVEKLRPLRRLQVLKKRLNDDTLHRSHVWKIKNEIKQIEESMNESD